MDDLRRFTSSSFPKAPTFKAAWLGISSNHSSNQHLVAMAATQPPQFKWLKSLEMLEKAVQLQSQTDKTQAAGMKPSGCHPAKKWCWKNHIFV